MLSRFTTFMPLAAEAVISVTAALKSVRDSSGDLPFSMLENVQLGLYKAKLNTFMALSEGAKAPGASQKFMADLGGPSTLGDFQQKAMEIEAKAAAWNSMLTTWFGNLPAASFIEVAVETNNGVSTKQIRETMFATEAQAMSIRQSPQLSDLITAFEAVGG